MWFSLEILSQLESDEADQPNADILVIYNWTL